MVGRIMARREDTSMNMVAHKVAIAIVTASRLMNVNPIRVARGDIEKGNGNYSLARARAYAAIGLRKMTDWENAAIARMVGSRCPHAFLTNVQKNMKTAKWWDETVVDQVTMALFIPPQEPEVTEELPPPPQPNPKIEPTPVPGRPFASERQKRAYEELQRAILNTATLQRPD
jgi:hypothetical protein